MGYTTEDRRQRALRVIANGKRPPHKVQTKAVQSALQTLATLDDRRSFFPPQHVKDTGWVESSHKASIHARIAGSGISLNGELVAVTDPPAAETHDANLGWREPTPDPKEQFNRAMRETGECLGKIVSWLAQSDSLSSLGTRSLALIATTQPSALNDCNGSQTGIASRFGITKQAVSKYVSELRDLAPGFQSRNMHPQSVRAMSRERATEQHQRAGHHMRGTT